MANADSTTGQGFTIWRGPSHPDRRKESCPWRSGWIVIVATGDPEPCRATAPAETSPPAHDLPHSASQNHRQGHQGRANAERTANTTGKAGNPGRGLDGLAAYSHHKQGMGDRHGPTRRRRRIGLTDYPCEPLPLF
ncbi:MAG: hypothetical protein NTX45_22495 [Proteobacteria bacterium]|nr:hypothetical protein [Pseudomonadota bacterium]